MLLLSGVSAIHRVPKLSVAILAMLMAGSVAGCDRKKQDGEQAGQAAPPAKEGPARFAYRIDRDHRGKPVPGAVFRGPDDAAVTLAAFRGRPLLVNLWATWCAPCIAEMPTLDALARESGDRMAVVAVAQDLQGAAVVDPWFQKAGLTTLQPYLDPQNALLDAFGAAGLPISIYYGADGREIWRLTGAIDWQGEEANKLLAEAG